MSNWLVFCVSAWSELANGGSGEKKNVTCTKINAGWCSELQRLRGTPSDQEGLTASLAFLEYTSLYHPRLAQVCLSVRILTECDDFAGRGLTNGKQQQQHVTTPGWVTSPVGQPQRHADRCQIKMKIHRNMGGKKPGCTHRKAHQILSEYLHSNYTQSQLIPF